MAFCSRCCALLHRRSPSGCSRCCAATLLSLIHIYIIVGDFDSAPCPQQNADDIVVLPHVKDDTDTEYAAKLAAQKGFDEVLLLGALGGKRVEHTLANLCTGLGLEPVSYTHPDVYKRQG